LFKKQAGEIVFAFHPLFVLNYIREVFKMILSGKKIHEEIKAGHIKISDFDPKRLGPNSYNLRLSREVCTYMVDYRGLDMKQQYACWQRTIPDEGFVMDVNNLYLCKTVEETFTNKYVPMIEGRSSVGRLGLFVHVTAGFGDVGFRGQWTLEIIPTIPIRVYPFVEICQIYFHTIEGDFALYDGKYQRSHQVQSSKLYEEF
jgi:dCTP deaminase